MNNYAQLVNSFKSLNNSRKKSFLNNLSIKEINLLKEIPDLFLRPDQIITSDARYIFYLCGRSFGHMASAWVAKLIRQGYTSIGIVGATYKDLDEVMIPAILSWFSSDEGAKYRSGNKCLITFKRYPKANIYCYSSDTEIRGPNLQAVWIDELCKACDSIPDKIKAMFNILDFAVRIRPNPQILVTTTPTPIDLLFKFEDRFLAGDPNVYIKYGTLMDNTALPQSFKDSMLKEYGKTRLGLQEIFGKLLRDTPGSAFSSEMIERDRITWDDFKAKLNKTIIKKDEYGYEHRIKPVELIRTIIAVDPSVTDTHEADEVGIICGVLLSDGRVYILEDMSGQYTTFEWAQKTYQAWSKYQGLVLVEANNGGELCKKNIKSVCSSIPVKLIRSTKGKLDRAFAASALYEQHLVSHVGNFPELEQQMTRYNGNKNMPSPGRLDSLTFLCEELKLNNTSSVADPSTFPTIR